MRKMCILSVAVSAILFAGTVMPGSDARAQSTGPVSVTQNGTTLVAPNVRCSGDPVASLTP